MDTNIAIDMRDRVPATLVSLAALGDVPAISFITLIELEGGVHRADGDSMRRRRSLDALLAETQVLRLDRTIVDAYGEIVATLGYSRRKVFDRLIAATAIVADCTLITANPADFHDIPGLRLDIWPARAAQ